MVVGCRGVHVGESAHAAQRDQPGIDAEPTPHEDMAHLVGPDGREERDGPDDGPEQRLAEGQPLCEPEHEEDRPDRDRPADADVDAERPEKRPRGVEHPPER